MKEYKQHGYEISFPEDPSDVDVAIRGLTNTLSTYNRISSQIWYMEVFEKKKTALLSVTSTPIEPFYNRKYHSKIFHLNFIQALA